MDAFSTAIVGIIITYFSIPHVKTAYDVSEYLSNFGPRIWNLVPSTLNEFFSHQLIVEDRLQN